MKLSEVLLVLLLRLRATFHTLPLFYTDFICERKFYSRMHVKITLQRKSTLNESCYKIKYVTLLPIFTLKLKRILSFAYLFSCSEDIENALKEKKYIFQYQ